MNLTQLDQRFVEPYLRGTRIRVHIPTVGERVGKVGVSCNPKPEFILITNRTDHTFTRNVLNESVEIVTIITRKRAAVDEGIERRMVVRRRPVYRQ